MDTWICPTDRFAGNILAHISYLREYNGKVKKPGFGVLIRLEHRPFFKDLVETMLPASEREKQREERDRILREVNKGNG